MDAMQIKAEFARWIDAGQPKVWIRDRDGMWSKYTKTVRPDECYKGDNDDITE